MSNTDGLWDVVIDGVSLERPLPRGEAQRLIASILREAKGRASFDLVFEGVEAVQHVFVDGQVIALRRFSDNRCPKCGDLWLAHEGDGSCLVEVDPETDQDDLAFLLNGHEIFSSEFDSLVMVKDGGAIRHGEVICEKLTQEQLARLLHDEVTYEFGGEDEMLAALEEEFGPWAEAKAEIVAAGEWKTQGGE